MPSTTHRPDWGNAGPEDKHLSSEDWILDYMPEAVERALSLAFNYGER